MIFGVLNFPLTRIYRIIQKSAPSNCYGYKLILNPKYSHFILNQTCDCKVWCKFPPSTQLQKN